MDSTNPLCRWLLAAGLAGTVGCVSNGVSGSAAARGQMPSDPIAPIAPTRPIAPSGPISPTGPFVPGYPISPLAPTGPGMPIPGRPVSAAPMDPVDPSIQRASYSLPPGSTNGVDLLKDGVPQIKVVALVGVSGLVTDQEVVEAVRQRDELRNLDGPSQRAKAKELYPIVLRKIIERELILDEMCSRLKKNNKSAMIDDIKEYATKAADSNLRAIRKELGLDTEEKFQMWLRAQGLSEPVIHRQMERQMMAEEYIRSNIKEKGIAPGFATLRTYYDHHPEEFKTEDKVKWLDIFINTSKHATPQAAYDHAESIRRQAASGADFVALAKKYDNGLAAGTNGVGVGSTRGKIQPEDVETTVWALQPGQVSTLIQTLVGYHIVKVVEREYAGQRPFDAKVQADIRKKIMEQFRTVEYDRMVEDLWRKGAVQVMEQH